MKSDDTRLLTDALQTLARVVADAASQRDEVRAAVHQIASWLAEETRSIPALRESPAAPPAVPPILGTPLRIPIEAPRPYQAGPLVQKELRLGDSRLPMHVPAAVGGLIEPADLTAAITGPTVVAEAAPRRRGEFATIAFRCRLKAEACLWAIEHWDTLIARLLAPIDLQAREDLIRRAKSVDGCWLWMLDATWLPADRAMLVLCGENYATLALAAEIADRCLLENPSEELLRLLAEAQSSLRAALMNIEIDNDSDQLDMFWWLRDLGQMHRIYIDRHMRRDDPADPIAWADLRSRIQAWADQHDSRRQSERVRAALIKKLEYHVKRLREGSPEDSSAHQRTILDCLGDWTRQGFYPSDPLLCRILLPVYDLILEDADDRDDVSPVLRAVDALAARQESQAGALELEPRRRSDEVLRAADILRGRTVVLIGGDVRPLSKRRLERDLELRELRWLSTSPHERHDALLPDIVRADVDAVLLVIRLTSHSHGDLADVCARVGKPFVRLPGGYGSAQVAHQVLEQISNRLAPAATASGH